MIEINDMYKHYYIEEEKVPVLDNINLSIEKGGFYSITGPSGSGKSSLLNIIGCLDRPSEGEISFNTRNITKYTTKELAIIRNKYIGFVFQQFHLLPRISVKKNVELPLIYAGLDRRSRKEKMEEVLEKVGLLDKMNNLPNTLSGGQKQRVAIARALINDPEFLLADEPTGSLDMKTSDSIMRIFLELNKEGTTILMVTHESHIAAFADENIYIYDGRISDRKGKVRDEPY
ncbi:ABC transporter ATP-binding protein [Sediminibacillus massiliensis]|uniref:ABC transporter ATP-binding protein n=1 Tax=Sediminibacillus massiliensis TaxID=1926277 RepID=UPI0009888AFB|nr:ABC transporter ATP-binding protein [Sediminibacillus massiliensis]